MYSVHATTLGYSAQVCCSEYVVKLVTAHPRSIHCLFVVYEIHSNILHVHADVSSISEKLAKFEQTMQSAVVTVGCQQMLQSRPT